MQQPEGKIQCNESDINCRNGLNNSSSPDGLNNPNGMSTQSSPSSQSSPNSQDSQDSQNSPNSQGSQDSQSSIDHRNRRGNLTGPRVIGAYAGKSSMTIRYIAEAAIIAAMYAALTIMIPGGSGQVQVRIAEALTVLPFFTAAAIPGLFVGCVVANIFVGAGPYDILFGSLATLVAAFLTYKMPAKYLAPLPPVIVNAVVVAFVLNISLQAPLFITMGFVAIGELIACYGLGYPLILLIEKQKARLFGMK